MKTIEIVKKIPYKRNNLMKTKILTKFQVYILTWSYLTATSSICYLYCVLTVKSSFCEHCFSTNGHSFKICDDTAYKFDQKASNMWI